jgi:thiol-disulfide isomerase/thioredoxin
MKTILSMVAAIAILFGANSAVAQNNYSISGTDEAFENGKTVSLTKYENNEFIVISSHTIADNKISFEGTVDEPARRYISIGEATPNEADIFFYFYLEAGQMTIEKTTGVRLGGYTVKGTTLNDINTEYKSVIQNLNERYSAANQAGDEQAIDAIMAEYTATSKAAILANADNIVGQDILSSDYSLFGAQELLDLLAALPENVQEKFAAIKANAEKSLLTEPGQPYIDFAEPGLDGQPISLKSVVENPANKYVLLDFWASWCGPCMGEVPHLLETYAEYHDKGFEIFGVSLDAKDQNWRDAIAEHKMNWVHVSNVKYWDTQSRKDYAVNSIPSNFLIDCATGKIVAKNLRGEALKKKIAELLD